MSKSIYFKALASLTIVAACASPVQAQNKSTGSLAKVNGVSIPESVLDQNVRLNVSQGMKDSPELRQMLKEELINREVLAQESARKKLDKTPEAQEQFAQLRQTFLVELLLNDYLKNNPVTDAEIKADYDRQVAAMANAQQYRLSLIVVKTEDEAKDVLARLRKGEAFAKLATDKSIDPSKKDGGDVGWVLPSQILPAISNVMVNLSKGGLSAAPIQTPAGWNIIRLDDTRTFKAPTLEESKENVRQMLMQQKRMAYIKKLRDAAKVTN